jgi:hypothetical protein
MRTPVEPVRLDQLDLATERHGVRGGQVRLGPVALGQHQTRVVRSTVEQETPVGVSTGAHAGVALDPIDDLFAIEERQLGVDQIRPPW